MKLGKVKFLLVNGFADGIYLERTAKYMTRKEWMQSVGKTRMKVMYIGKWYELQQDLITFGYFIDLKIPLKEEHQ